MTNQAIALGVILLFVVGATVVGMIPGIKKKMTLEEWAVGGRSFGRMLNWFILAGEIYTAFAFLGGSGWAYARGGPTFYILGYCSIAYVVGYYVLPAMAPMGRRHGLMTQPDLVEHLYESRALGILTACVGVTFLLPYLQLQLTGLGLIIETCSYGLITRVPAMLAAFTMVAAFVYLSGLKGVAATAVIKDVVMILAVAFFGLYLPDPLLRQRRRHVSGAGCRQTRISHCARRHQDPRCKLDDVNPGLDEFGLLHVAPPYGQ